MSPTKFKPNLCAVIRQTMFAVCPIVRQKSFSSYAQKKPSRYVDEIDPGVNFINFLKALFTKLFCAAFL